MGLTARVPIEETCSFDKSTGGKSVWDPNEIVMVVAEVSEVTRLPKGAVVGDNCGGRSFNDNVAAALERRSCRGWRDVSNGDQRWTLILIER